MVHPREEPEVEPPKRQARHDAADHRQQERWRNPGDGETVRRGGSHREAIDEERTGVIQQTLAFENGQKAVRRSQLAQHGGCGESVWATTATAAAVNPTAKTTSPATGAQLSLRSLSDAS